MSRALITGITGQDGSYLAELLLGKGYEVHGLVRRSSTSSTSRISHLCRDADINDVRLFLHYGDVCDSSNLVRLMNKIRPDEVYHLAAQSHVRISFDIPEYTLDTTGASTLRVLEAIRESGSNARFYQAGSSEMFGKAATFPLNESTPFNPRSPYACAKTFAHLTTVNYRESYGMFVCNGILFNHESPRRGEAFVTRKITQAVACIKAGAQDKLYLGNLNAKRDWGYAPEYVEAMWMMLQQDEPDDFVIATGESHSVQEFLDLAFEYASLDWRKHVEFDERYSRPSEVDHLLGDSSKAATKLGWVPSTDLSELAKLMVDSDMESVSNLKSE